MGIVPDIFRVKRVDEQTVLVAPPSFDGERWQFPENGQLFLPACETQLPGNIQISAGQQAVRFVPEVGRRFGHTSEDLAAYLVPFHEIVEQYRQGLDVMAMMKKYDVSRQFFGNERLTYGAQTSLVVKEQFSGVDVFRANLGDRSHGVESVEVERYARASVGNFVNVDSRLRRGKNTLHLVSGDVAPVVHPWSNTVGLVDFIPPVRLNEEGHKLSVSYMAFAPQVTLQREGHRISIAVCSSLNEEHSSRVGVFYKGAWHPSEVVDLDIPEVESLAKPLTKSERERAQVVIQSVAGAACQPQDLAVLQFVRNDGRTYFLYEKSTDFGILRSGILEHETIAPHVSEKSEETEHIVYQKETRGKTIEELSEALRRHSVYFKLDKYMPPEKVQTRQAVTIV